jgi:hypothetical protein
MMRFCLLLLLVFTLTAMVGAQSWPQPPVVRPGASAGAPPADAVILFDGSNLDKWRNPDGEPTGCKVEQKEMVCRSKDGHAFSREEYVNAQIHVEYKLPVMPDQKGQLRGNSGIYLHGRYEVQVLDGWDNPTYPMGVVGAVYNVAPPLVNASRKAGEWQSYDIIFHAPSCHEDQLIDPGTVTIFLNGVLVQDHVSLMHRPGDCARGRIPKQGPLMLQDHSGFKNAPHTEMRFRNIWFRRLD